MSRNYLQIRVECLSLRHNNKKDLGRSPKLLYRGHCIYEDTDKALYDAILENVNDEAISDRRTAARNAAIKVIKDVAREDDAPTDKADRGDKVPEPVKTNQKQSNKKKVDAQAEG